MTKGTFVPKTDLLDHRFVYLKARVEGSFTTISFDPFVAEMLSHKLGSESAMKEWVAGRANMIAGFIEGKKKAGLSRLVQREALRLLLAPSKADIEFIEKLQKEQNGIQAVSA